MPNLDRRVCNRQPRGRYRRMWRASIYMYGRYVTLGHFYTFGGAIMREDVERQRYRAEKADDLGLMN